MFLDALMQDLNRDCYLAFLNAAVFHGASHQQPQEFFVVTGFPVLRSMKKNGLTVNFICKREIPVGLLDIRKTETGYLKISNAALTATDLVQYAKHVVCINRVATILNELASQLNTRDFDELLLQHVPVSVLQRLGYLLDNVVNRPLLASTLFRAMQSSEMELFRTPLTNASTIQAPGEELVCLRVSFA
jgi:predicted transcriptional regulator of viral defense system